MTLVRTTLLSAALILGLAGAAHAQATLSTFPAKVPAGAAAVCVAANLSTSSQQVTVYLNTTEGREIKTCGYTRAWDPGRVCVTQERVNTTAFCKIDIEAPGDATSVRGSFIITDSAGNTILLLEARP